MEAKLVSRIQTTPIHTGSVHFILYTEQPPNWGIICVYNLLQSIPAITSLEGLELNTRRKILVFVVGHQNLEKSDLITNRYGIWLLYRLVELVNEQISSRWHVSLCQSQQERPLSHPLACHTYLICQGFAGKVKQPVCSRTWLVTSAHQPWTTGVWAGPLGKTWCLILC